MTCAGTVVAPPWAASAAIVSVTSMSRSVALSRRPEPSPRRRTFDKIGIVLRRSTTRCTCPSDRRSAARSTVTFMDRTRHFPFLGGTDRPRRSLGERPSRLAKLHAERKAGDRPVNNARASRRPGQRARRLFLEHALQELDLVMERRVLAEALLDLAHRVQDGRVIA